MPTLSARPTWLHRDRLVPRAVGRPLARFIATEAAGGVLLLAATVAALVWVNSPWSASYEQFWHTGLSIDLGDWGLSLDLRHWVGDGLMALFFFVIGLEIKQELVSGQLADRREALVPAVGALGGMAVPALLYVVVNRGGPGSDGWAIPAATDIAFAVGVLSLLGPRVPSALKVLLLGVAIVDDIGAIVVIAAFYSDGLDLRWAGVAVAGLVLVGSLRRARVWSPPVYGGVALVVWLATLESGVHATIAGVALGLLVPARPLLDSVDADRVADQLSTDDDVTASEVREVGFHIRESVPVSERLSDLLHPWTSFVVVPLFALANAGIELSSDRLSDAATSPITLGVVLGLVVGKVVGVTGAIAAVTRLGPGRLPAGVSLRHVVGMAGLAGIGFTVSLFITGLAFDDGRADEAKIGILVASTLAAALGALILRRAAPGETAADDDG